MKKIIFLPNKIFKNNRNN